MRLTKHISLSLAFIFLLSFKMTAQDVYSTSGWEMIFSSANATQNDFPASGPLRWAPVFNVQSMLNVDFGKSFGLFTGLGIRNVGFIYDDPEIPNVRYKFRNYTLGIPAGFKVGNMNGLFIYGGYELEFPFHFKEKVFLNGNKEDVNGYWFSNRSETIFHTVLAGIQFPYGANLKFKYYLNNFFNQDFEATAFDDNGDPYIEKPYAGHEANIFFFSLSFNLFKNAELYYYKPE